LISLECKYGTAGDGDDRQRNGPSGESSAAFLFLPIGPFLCPNIPG
jgi:hypothetical protein